MINNQPAAAENGQDGEIFLSIDVGGQHQGAQVRQRDPISDQLWLQRQGGSRRKIEGGSFCCQVSWVDSLPNNLIVCSTFTCHVHYHLVLGHTLSLTPDRLSALLSTRCPGGQSTASFISSGYSVSLILNVKQN